MKVLITGAAGFIGSNLVHYLTQVRPEWRITALDLLTYAGNLKNISSLIDAGKVAFVKADIVDGPAMVALFEKEGFDLVLHLAAESHVDRSILSAAEFVRTNVLGTQILLNATLDLHRAGKKIRFVHVSTDEVYGSLGSEGVFTEETPLEPTSPYAASKASSDLMVLAMKRTHGMDALITRCTNNYGAFQFPEKFIPLFVTNCLEGKKLPLYGSGLQVRSWIHVLDHAAGILAAAERGKSGEVYNFGGGPEGELPNAEVAKRIMQVLEVPPDRLELVRDRPGHDFRYAVDNSKSMRELGWKPGHNFAQGLPETVRWYKENRAWWEEIKSGAYQQFYSQNYLRRNELARS